MMRCLGYVRSLVCPSVMYVFSKQWACSPWNALVLHIELWVLIFRMPFTCYLSFHLSCHLPCHLSCHLLGNFSEEVSFVIAEGPESVRPDKEEIVIDDGKKLSLLTWDFLPIWNKLCRCYLHNVMLTILALILVSIVTRWNVQHFLRGVEIQPRSDHNLLYR